MVFAKRVFTWAGFYGLIVLTPMYFLELAPQTRANPISHPELLYGFVGTALAFQVLFLAIGRDPVAMRPAMLAAILEKFSFGLAVWPLFLMGRSPGTVTAFASVDLALGVLFCVCWFRTAPKTDPPT